MNNRYFSTVKQKVLLIVEIIKKKKQTCNPDTDCALGPDFLGQSLKWAYEWEKQNSSVLHEL